MINLMRKNQRSLMLIISILTIVAFVFLYNRTDMEKLNKASVATIYGKPMGLPEFERMARQLRVAYSMGLRELVQATAGSSVRDDGEEYVWNTVVLRHVAAQLQIEPSLQSISDRTMTLPAFQTNGKFDIAKYDEFTTNVLLPQGYSKTQMDELVADDLRLSRLKELLGSSMAVSSAEVHEEFAKAYQKRHIAFVRLKRDDFSKAAVVTPAEIKEYFDKNQASYKTEEKRIISYVSFVLPEKDRALKGKELVTALKPLVDKAEAFSQKMVEPGAKIEEVAVKLEVPVKVTPAFTAGTPPPEVAGVSTFADTAFALTPESPDSDVIQTETAYYLLHLDKIEKSQPETLEQATSKITTELIAEKTIKAMGDRATELKKQFTEAVRSGKTFAQATEAAGLKAETVPPTSPAEPGEDMTARTLLMQMVDLKPGAITDLIETPDGGDVAYLEKVDPLDESLWEKRKDEILKRFNSERRELNFTEWLHVQRQRAQVQLASR